MREHSGGGPTVIPADEQPNTGAERERAERCAGRIYKGKESNKN